MLMSECCDLPFKVRLAPSVKDAGEPIAGVAAHSQGCGTRHAWCQSLSECDCHSNRTPDK